MTTQKPLKVGSNGLSAEFATSDTIPTTAIASSAISYAQIQNESADTILGNPTGSPAAPSEITMGSLMFLSGTAISNVDIVAYSLYGGV